MDVIMLSIPRLLFCVLDIYMFCRFFKAIFDGFSSMRRLSIGCVLIAILSFIINSFGLTGLNLVFIPILYFGFALYVFQIPVGCALVYTIIFYTIFAGGEAALEIIFRFLSQNQIFMIAWQTSENEIFYFVIAYILKYFYLLAIERPLKKLEIKKEQKFAWYLIVIPISTIIILSSFMYMEFPVGYLQQVLISVGGLLLYFSNAVIFFILEKYHAIMKQIEEDRLYKIKQEAEDENIQNIMELNEKYRCYMHDFHSYLNNIRLLALEGETQAIINIINEKEGIMQEDVNKDFYCANSVLNTIFVEYSAKAKSRGIQIEIQVEKFLNVDFISDADIVSLFGNLLNNSIEAAERCCDGERIIKVCLYMGNQFILVFRIENTFKIKPNWQGNKLQTTKKESAQHGLGIGIVMKLAHKYGGVLTLEEKNNMFVTILTISSKVREGKI